VYAVLLNDCRLVQSISDEAPIDSNNNNNNQNNYNSHVVCRVFVVRDVISRRCAGESSTDQRRTDIS